HVPAGVVRFVGVYVSTFQTDTGRCGDFPADGRTLDEGGVDAAEVLARGQSDCGARGEGSSICVPLVQSPGVVSTEIHFVTAGGKPDELVAAVGTDGSARDRRIGVVEFVEGDACTAQADSGRCRNFAADRRALNKRGIETDQVLTGSQGDGRGGG